ncbi:MAG: ATP-binding protein [Lachnospiraceae bacterium]|nr:ATP-binding protein [Lachnospiraceae bacterium]
MKNGCSSLLDYSSEVEVKIVKTYLEVENFGKIKSAKVASNGFTVFIGDNNSGKSYLMQLIYAIKKNINSNFLEGGFVKILQKKMQNSTEVSLNSDDLKVLVEDVNTYLNREKERIVQRTFRKPINIGSIKLDLELYESDEVSFRFDEVESGIQKFQNGNNNVQKKYKTFEIIISGSHYVYLISEITPVRITEAIAELIFGSHKQMYLPAARAGIQLLYKDFFASKADDLFYAQDNRRDDISLTEPIYDYLRFLQMMSSPRTLNDDALQLINFIENNIIDGHIDINEKNDITYSQRNGVQNVPLYIASSMIGEVTPIIECIMDGYSFEYIIIDEIESSLHPKKQREVARLLNRMRNIGYELLVSTHSDSMAAYINNLLIASRKELGEQALEKIGLSREDLLVDKDVRFYEFRNSEDGRSEVKELPVNKYPMEGVQFSLFNQNIDQLYRESTYILEGTNEATG